MIINPTNHSTISALAVHCTQYRNGNKPYKSFYNICTSCSLYTNTEMVINPTRRNTNILSEISCRPLSIVSKYESKIVRNSSCLSLLSTNIRHQTTYLFIQQLIFRHLNLQARDEIKPEINASTLHI